MEETRQSEPVKEVNKDCLTSVTIPQSSPNCLTRYANYLKAFYAQARITFEKDKWPLTPSTTYVRLALIKKEKVGRREADHFTCLTLQGHIDQILKAKQPIRLEDVLEEDNAHGRLTVLEGAPGIGKSTFAWELCRQWPTLGSLKRFKLVVLLRLREEGVQIAKNVSDLLYHRDKELCRCVGVEVEKMEGEGVLLVFDGFDEFPAELRTKSLVTDVISGFFLPNATVLVTSRPSATAELLSVCQTHVGKHIEVVGFSEREIQEYAESVLGAKPELLKNFQTYLSVNPVVKGMMYNPLNCGMVMEMYRENHLSHKPILHTQTKLYTELSLCLLSRHLSADGNPLAKKLPDRLEHIPSELYQQLVKIGRLAFEGRVREEVIFKQLPEGCSALGLLNTYSALYGRREDVTYSFLHLTLQEYLAAFYISQLLPTEQKQIFAKHHSCRHLNIVWRFVAGLTRMQAIGWEEFRKREVVEEDRMLDNMDSVYEVGEGVVKVTPAIVQCLYEAQDAESCRSVFGQSSVEYCGQRCSALFDAYAVGCCVSLCENDWNIDLSLNDLGPEMVEMLVCGLTSINSNGGSVKELNLSYNPIKDEGMKYFQRFSNQILSKIKTLDLSDCGLYQTGFDLLSNTLPSFLSLNTLDISLNPGGNGSTVELLQTLGKHQRVKCLGMKYTGIGMADVLALSNVIQQSGSLTELAIGRYRMSPECAQQMVRTVLSPSSLSILRVWVPSSLPVLDSIDAISDNLTELAFQSEGALTKQLPSNKGDIMISNILKENKTLKELELRIPLETTIVKAIANSLKHNHTLTSLRLSKPSQHFKYLSGVEQQELDNRLVWLY